MEDKKMKKSIQTELTDDVLEKVSGGDGVFIICHEVDNGNTGESNAGDIAGRADSNEL